MNKITYEINDEAINNRFKTYLKEKAVKYFPFLVIEALMFYLVDYLVSGFNIRNMLWFFYLLLTVFGLIVVKRHLWTVSYVTIFCI